jgi:hypothetical protein
VRSPFRRRPNAPRPPRGSLSDARQSLRPRLEELHGRGAVALKRLDSQSPPSRNVPLGRGRRTVGAGERQSVSRSAGVPRRTCDITGEQGPSAHLPAHAATSVSERPCHRPSYPPSRDNRCKWVHCGDCRRRQRAARRFGPCRTPRPLIRRHDRVPLPGARVSIVGARRVATEGRQSSALGVAIGPRLIRARVKGDTPRDGGLLTHARST